MLFRSGDKKQERYPDTQQKRLEEVSILIIGALQSCLRHTLRLLFFGQWLAVLYRRGSLLLRKSSPRGKSFKKQVPSVGDVLLAAVQTIGKDSP